MGISIVSRDKFWTHNGQSYSGNVVGYNVDQSGVQFPDNWGVNERITIRTDSRGASSVTLSGLSETEHNTQYLRVDINQDASKWIKGGSGGQALNPYSPFTITQRLEPNKTYYLWLFCNGRSHKYNDSGLKLTAKDLNITLSLSPTTLSTGGTLTLTIGNAGSTALTAKVTHGSTTLLTKSFSGGSTSFVCPKSWFDSAGITTDKSMTLTVTITGGPNTPTGNFTLQAGTDMRPSVSNVSVTLVQPEKASAFPDSWISNISRATIRFNVTLNSAAAVHTATVSFNGNSVTAREVGEHWEATTESPVTGDGTFSVTVTDNRGLSGSGSKALSGVVSYAAPSVVIESARREGAACYLTVSASYTTALSGNEIEIHAGPKGGVQTAVLPDTETEIAGFEDENQNLTLRVTITDTVGESSSVELRMEGKGRNVVVRRSVEGTYVGIGTTPETQSGKSTIELPEGGRILIGGVDLLELLFPVGTIYGTTESAGPGKRLGGTWTAIGDNRWKRTA